MRSDRYTTQLCEAVTAKLKKETPRIPAGAAPLWRAFCEMSRARSWHRFGPNPISFVEMESWMRLTRTPLQPHHVQIIQAMDGVFLEHFALSNDEASPDGVKTLQRGSGQSLSPELFDAVLG